MFKKLLTTRSVCLSAMIAALYAALTILLAPISYGSNQCRVSEAMTLLPNLAVWDVLFGTLATLIAAVGTYALRRKPLLAARCPVVANGIIVGAMLSVFYALPLWLTMAEVAVGEVAAVGLGLLLLPAMRRLDLSRFQ